MFKKFLIRSCSLKSVYSTTSLVLLTLLLSGCGKNLSVVKQFGETIGKARETSEEISLDIYNSCLRRLKYISLNQPSIPNQEQKIFFTERDKAEDKCNSENKIAADSVVEANKILINYAETLGKLADKNLASPDEDLNKLRESLTKLNIPLSNGGSFQLPREEVDAGFKILNFVIKAKNNNFRRKQIKAAILCTDGDVQKYITGLRKIHELHRDNILRIEELTLRSYYTTIIGSLQLGEQVSALDFVELKEKINRDIQLVQDKKNQTQRYIDFLSNTANTHKKLYENFLGENKSQISSDKLSRLCNDFSTVSNDQGIINSQLILKREQIKKAQEIVLKYKESVEPLLVKHYRLK